jgi:hypothetical protein
MLTALLTVCGGENPTIVTTEVSSSNTSVASTDDGVEVDIVQDDTSSSAVAELSEPFSATEKLWMTANTSESMEVNLIAGDVLVVEISLEGHSTGGSASSIGQAGVSTKVTVAVTNGYDEVIFMKAEVQGQPNLESVYNVVQAENVQGEILEAITIEDTGTHTISVFNPMLLQGQSAEVTYHINQ